MTLIRAMHYGLTALLIALWAMVFMTSRWDWDIDHMFYFGGRLLAGDLHWTLEFDDKLPVNQMVFVLPALFQSRIVWLLMSMAACLSAAWAVGWITRQVLGDLSLRETEVRDGSAMAALALLLGQTVAQGGIPHVNPIAAAAAIDALALVMYARQLQGSGFVSTMLLSAALASLAIGMRPYFLLPICAGAIWACLRDPRGSRVRAFAAASFWIVCVGFFGVLANFMPYVLLGKTEAFRAGMSILAQRINPQPLAAALYSELRAFSTGNPFASLMVVLSAGAIVMTLRRNPGRRSATDVIVLTAILPLLLQAMIMQKHFWPHYIQMFTPFLAIGSGIFSGLIGDLLQERRATRTGSHGTRFVAFGAITAALLCLSYGSARVVGHMVKPVIPSQSGQAASDLSRWLATRPEGQRDFLVPSAMFPHWQLKESRHGFPHAANTLQIIAGWFETVEIPEWFDFPTSVSAFCAKMERSGPSVIILTGEFDRPLEDCLVASPTYARISGSPDFASLHKDFRIFERTR